jgi:hypothetical protein
VTGDLERPIATNKRLEEMAAERKRDSARLLLAFVASLGCYWFFFILALQDSDWAWAYLPLALTYHLVWAWAERRGDARVREIMEGWK